MRRHLIAALLIAAAAAAASPGPEDARAMPLGEAPEAARGAADGLALPASTEFPALVGNVRELSFEVGKFRAPDGKRWIRIRGEYDSAYRASMEDVIATLRDYPNSPKVFSRIEATRVRSDEGDVAVTEQRTGIHVLGFSYISNLVFRTELRRPGPGTAVLESEAIEVDGTTLSSRGSWTLAEGADESGPLTYVRYSLDSSVKPAFPAQEWLMRSFGGADFRRIVRELEKAALARPRTD